MQTIILSAISFVLLRFPENIVDFLLLFLEGIEKCLRRLNQFVKGWLSLTDKLVNMGIGFFFFGQRLLRVYFPGSEYLNVGVNGLMLLG